MVRILDEHAAAVVRVAAFAVLSLALAGCGSNPSSQASRPGQPAPELLRPSPTVPSTPSLAVVPKSKPTHLAAAARGAPRPPAGVRPPSAGSLLWPVRGQVLTAFGEQPSGALIDGLDIVASEGTPVLAAADGVVGYAGGDLPGYGNMLMIAHPGGYVTVYAHNRHLLVGAGANVRRGQPVATVGRTGDRDVARLHFQLRAGGRPVDPERYLEAVPTVLASLAPTAAPAISAR
jgi:murein DD-endopeptidase MepM/ murein hydrolase activator NlpD